MAVVYINIEEFELGNPFNITLAKSYIPLIASI